jgi:drug/metabolite transporter (DMT)-like permease
MPNAVPLRSSGFDATALLMGAAFAAIWSSAFSSAKIALAYAPPFLMLGLRFAISGLIAVGIAWALASGSRPTGASGG